MKTYIRVKNRKQLEQVAENEAADAIICGLGCVSYISSDKFKEKNKKEIFIAFPEIAREERIGSLKKIVGNISMGQIPADGIVIENLDELGLLAEEHYSGQVIGGSFLYAYNSEAVSFYRQFFPEMKFMAPDELTLAETAMCGEAAGHCSRPSESNQQEDPKLIPELNGRDMFADKENAKGAGLCEKNNKPGRMPFIYKVYGHQPVMVTNQCMNRNYCGCEKPLLEFRDGKNNSFFITSECGQCYDIVYNGPATFMLDKFNIEKNGKNSTDCPAQSRENGILPDSADCPAQSRENDILLDFTVETPEDVREIMCILDSALSGKRFKPENYTRGHFYRKID